MALARTIRARIIVVADEMKHIYGHSTRHPFLEVLWQRCAGDVDFLARQGGVLGVDEARHVFVVEAAKEDLEALGAGLGEVLARGRAHVLLLARQHLLQLHVVRGSALTFLHARVADAAVVAALLFDDVTGTNLIGED